ncbi:MAG: hypothetical protein SO485_14360, partial [Parabacteroides distasonis]|nr:hypothetical protein [Parabacteroides distasonis]
CPISLAQPITGDAPYSRLPLTEQRVKSCNIHCCLTINYVTFQVTPMYDSALTGKMFFKEIGHEDYVCWLSILKQGYKAQNTNTVTALYRVGDHSVSSNKLKAMRWQWNILRNEMDLPVYKAVYYFIHYAIRAFAKAMR